MNATLIADVVFPKPTPGDVNINMMPFVMGDPDSIPSELKGYQDLIDSCEVEQFGKIGYLTISESTVTSNTSQRRGGIHTESPGKLLMWGGSNWGGGTQIPQEPKPKPKPKPSGGLYMASNVTDSCRFWDTRIESPGKMGDCEHLRSSLGEGQYMKNGQLWWMTDRCPHESLPIPADTHRQFFRLVTNQVSFWFSQHSTANPLGILPDCPIIDVNKFSL